MRITLAIIYLFFWSSCCSAQWQNLNLGLSGAGYDMYYDTTDNLLYVGGFFDYADNNLVKGIAVWDGQTWDSLGAGTYSFPVYSVTKYNGGIFASGIFKYDPSYIDSWLAFWNGQKWDTLPERVNSSIKVFKEYNGELYFGGAFERIGQNHANLLAKYDGTSFTALSVPSEGGGFQVLAIEFYQGQMYIGGNFYDTLTGVNDLERWNGSAFEPFGGISPGFGASIVSAMVIHKNELYIAGSFNVASGFPSNNIVRWDGHQFKDVGGGTNDQIKKMYVFNDEIYVSGYFSMAGNVPANMLAKWDGQQWSEVCHGNYNNIITDFIVVGNDLYVTGGFTMIDSVPISYIGKYANIISVPEIEQIQFTLSPNPASDHVSVSSQVDISRLRVLDLQGRLIHAAAIRGREYTLSIRDLSPGIYLFEVETEAGRMVRNLAKE